MNFPEYQKQAKTKREPNIHKASFIKRRLFYLNYLHVVAKRFDCVRTKNMSPLRSARRGDESLRPERSRMLLCGVVEGGVLSLSKGQLQAKVILKIKLCYKGM